MARREQDLNGADGTVINGTATTPQWQAGQAQRAPYASAQQTGEPAYRAADRDDAAADADLGAGPNLLVGRVALTQDAYDGQAVEDEVVVEDPRPADSLGGTSDGLLSEEEAEEFRSRWPGIKATFVDDPHDSIRHADLLVREVTEMVMRRINDERARLASLWDDRGEVSTEDLRLALRGYQGFFDQLADVPERSDG